MTRPIRDIGDAVQDVPGVYVEASKTGANTISMRGLDSGYTLILVDGKRQNVAQGFDANGISSTTSFMPPASMIERIEVIRGPASLIYGSDAMGGVINIITKKHTKTTTAGIQIDTRLSEQEGLFGVERNHKFGNIYGANAYLNTPLIDDILSLNLRGGYKYGEQNAFYKPDYILANQTGTSAANPYLGWSATGFVQYNLGGRLNWTPNKHHFIYFDSEMHFGRYGSLNTSSNSVTAIRDFYKYNNVLSYDIDYDWGKLSSYIQHSYTTWAANSDLNCVTTAGRNTTETCTVVNIPIGSTKGDILRWDNARINHDLVYQTKYFKDFDLGRGGNILFNGGIYYFLQSLENKSSDFKRTMNQVAAFVEGEYLINQYVSTTLGVRYNYSDIFSAVPNPRFYINVNPTEWLTIKAGVQSGVRVPNLSYLYEGYIESTSNNSTIYTYGNKDLKPELSWNYEVSTIFDFDPAMLILTGYYTDFRNQIETVPFADGDMCQATGSTNVCRTYRNIDKSRMTGAEVGLKTKPIFGFSLDANYAFTHTEVLKYSAIGNVGEDPVGKAVNSIPRHNFTITPRYTYQNLSAYIRWSGRYKTPTPTATGTNAGSLDQTKNTIGNYYKDYQIVDVALTYKFNKQFALTFAVNNLLDVNFIDLVPYSNNTNVINRYQRILPSRNYWISFRADF